jgi:hypothetical protein
MSSGGHKPLDLPMQVAKAFVKDMRARQAPVQNLSETIRQFAQLGLKAKQK